MSFIELLERKNLLIRVETPVSSYLEITEIVDRVSKMKDGGKALLFTNVEGADYPVLINALGSYQRIELGLGDTPNGIGNTIGSIISIRRYATLWGKIRAIPLLLRMAFSFPIKLPRRLFFKRPPCQEVVEEPNLDRLPVLHCWPEDGGPFFTLPLVFTRDPDTGRQNVGMYRMQVFDKSTTGMHWHLHKDGREIFEAYRRRGEPMPVSVVLSCDPTIIYGAIAPMPNFIDEMALSGFLRKRPVPMVKCFTNGIYVPRSAEFVLEGEVGLEELRKEGPFGDHTGYYSLEDQYPVFRIKRITRKREPIYPATIVGQPPMEDCYLGKATERIFLPLLKIMVPDVLDIELPLEGVFHNCAIVSIKKRFVTHGAKVLSALWGSGQMMYTKMIIVVDESVDPHNYQEVLQVVLRYGLEEESLILSQGPLDALDHASPLAFQGFRLGIDATKKLPHEYGVTRDEAEDREGRWMESIAFAGAGARLGEHGSLTKRLKEQFPAVVDTGLLPDFWGAVLPVVVDKSVIEGGVANFCNALLESLLMGAETQKPRLIILIDPSVNKDAPSQVFWKLFNNIAPERDMYRFNRKGSGSNGVSGATGAAHKLGAAMNSGVSTNGFSVAGQPEVSAILFDATKKGAIDNHTRAWPNDIVMSQEIKDLVDKKWDQYGIN